LREGLSQHEKAPPRLSPPQTLMPFLLFRIRFFPSTSNASNPFLSTRETIPSSPFLGKRRGESCAYSSFSFFFPTFPLSLFQRKRITRYDFPFFRKFFFSPLPCRHDVCLADFFFFLFFFLEEIGRRCFLLLRRKPEEDHRLAFLAPFLFPVAAGNVFFLSWRILRVFHFPQGAHPVFQANLPYLTF